MSYQPNPRYFDWGGQFQEGIQQSQDNKRRNALLDLEQRQFGLQERQVAGQERRYAAGEQERQAAMQSAQAREGIGLKALAAARGDRQSAAAVLQELGLPLELADDPDAGEMYQAIAEQYGGFQLPQGMRPPAAYQEYQLGQQDPGFAAYLARQNQPQAPTGTWSQPIEVVGPDGNPMLIQSHSVTGETRPVEGVRPKAKAAVSPKDAITARQKINIVKLARQQLANVREKFKGVKGTFSAGLGQGWVPSEAGNAFDKSIDIMRSTLTSLTRVPGVGAMSDYETRLDQAKFPKRGDYESVSEDNIEQLDAMLNAIETGYNDLLSGSQPNAQPANAGGPTPGEVVDGYRFKGGDPAKQENWVKQ